jgi:O-antigen ligase
MPAACDRFRLPASTPPEALHATAHALAHRCVPALVWLAIASSAVVLGEPAPFDLLMLALIAVLPFSGLAAFTPAVLIGVALSLLLAGAGLLASLLAADVQKAMVHALVTLYLSLAAMGLAAFVARDPEKHGRLVMQAWLWAAGLAALAGIVGYFALLPDFEELFTNHGRARGTFKDPNVFGPFLVPALVYAAQLWLARDRKSGLLPLALTVVLGFALLLSFSRGAWINLALAMAAFAVLAYRNAGSWQARRKLLAAGAACLVVLAATVSAAVQLDSVETLLAERASLDQSYDQGPEGRFGAHAKARSLIVQSPAGIGAGTFAASHHHEDAHNVYLSMFLNAGWLGGFLYLGALLAALAFGLLAALRAGPGRDLAVVAWCCFLAVALEGMVVDTDHWRHVFVLLGLLLGLAAAPATPTPRAAGRVEPRH